MVDEVEEAPRLAGQGNAVPQGRRGAGEIDQRDPGFAFDVRQIVERISMFWVELQSLFVAAFGFGDKKTVLECIGEVAICVGKIRLN